jgi:hypothetical protein
MDSSKKNCLFIILPCSFFLNIGASNFYLEGSLKCNKNIYKIKDIGMRRVKVFPEVIEHNDSHTGCLIKNASTHNFFIYYPISMNKKTKDMVFHAVIIFFLRYFQLLTIVNFFFLNGHVVF